MFCQKCGQDNSESAGFCKSCGSPLIKTTNTQGNASTWNNGQSYNQQNSFQQSSYNQPAYPMNDPRYKPISMWGYFGYEILFAIPLIGFILILVFSFGGTSNINLRNFARSYFCVIIVILALLLFFSLLGFNIIYALLS